MPKKGKGKGKGKKKGGKGWQNRKNAAMKVKGDDQVYGVVTKAFGASRFEVQCYDGKTRNCGLRGRLRNRGRVARNRICLGDIVLVDLGVGLSNDDGGMISFKYLPDEIKQLKKDKELPKKITKIEEEGTGSGDDDAWDGFNYL